MTFRGGLRLPVSTTKSSSSHLQCRGKGEDQTFYVKNKEYLMLYMDSLPVKC